MRIPIEEFNRLYVRLPNRVVEKRIPLNDGKEHSFQCHHYGRCVCVNGSV